MHIEMNTKESKEFQNVMYRRTMMLKTRKKLQLVKPHAQDQSNNDLGNNSIKCVPEISNSLIYNGYIPTKMSPSNIM